MKCITTLYTYLKGTFIFPKTLTVTVNSNTIQPQAVRRIIYVIAMMGIFGANPALAQDPASPLSDTFTLMSGNRVVETLTFTEAEEPGSKTFNAIFGSATKFGGATLNLPFREPGTNNISDMAEFFRDPANPNNIRLRVSSDAGDPATNDTGESGRFNIRLDTVNGLVPNPVADTLVVQSDVPTIPEPSIITLYTAGLLVIFSLVWLRKQIA
jgi:hypothetical protein